MAAYFSTDLANYLKINKITLKKTQYIKLQTENAKTSKEKKNHEGERERTLCHLAFSPALQQVQPYSFYTDHSVAPQKSARIAYWNTYKNVS